MPCSASNAPMARVPMPGTTSTIVSPGGAGRLGEFPVQQRDPEQNQDQNNYQKTSHKRGPLVDWILHLDFMMRFSCALRNAPERSIWLG